MRDGPIIGDRRASSVCGRDVLPVRALSWARRCAWSSTGVTALTATTWNVRNLFPPTTSGGPDADAYQAKLAALAGLIDGVAPDVLAVQEIEP